MYVYFYSVQRWRSLAQVLRHCNAVIFSPYASPPTFTSRAADTHAICTSATRVGVTWTKATCISRVVVTNSVSTRRRPVPPCPLCRPHFLRPLISSPPLAVPGNEDATSVVNNGLCAHCGAVVKDIKASDVPCPLLPTVLARPMTAPTSLAGSAR